MHSFEYEHENKIQSSIYPSQIIKVKNKVVYPRKSKSSFENLAETKPHNAHTIWDA